VAELVIARNPDGDSRLPYLLRLPLGEAGLVLKARETWPRTAKVYCHPSDDWPDEHELEIVERVAVRSCVRRGAAVDLVLDRGRENRSQFVFARARGREVIFWQTARTNRQARPAVSVPTRRASGRTLEILVDSHERYAWKFNEQQATTRRQALAAGDREALALRLHSLKGNAGNVGALTLMAAAGRLEAAVMTGATGPAGAAARREASETDLELDTTQREAGLADLEAGLADLERQVAALIAASTPWCEMEAAALATTTAPPLDPARLADLREALRRHDLAASDHFEELAASLTAAWGAETSQALGEAIADLRFDVALAQLDRHTPGTAA